MGICFVLTELQQTTVSTESKVRSQFTIQELVSPTKNEKKEEKNLFKYSYRRSPVWELQLLYFLSCLVNNSPFVITYEC